MKECSVKTVPFAVIDPSTLSPLEGTKTKVRLKKKGEEKKRKRKRTRKRQSVLPFLAVENVPFQGSSRRVVRILG